MKPFIRIITALICLFASSIAAAQNVPLTSAQLGTLKANILASELAVQCVTYGDGPYNVAAAYNLAASPAWYAYRTRVNTVEIGNAFNGTEVAGLSSLNMQRLQLNQNYSDGTVDFSRADRRQLFTDVFSGAGGTNTRVALAVIWSRTVTRFERIYATGTGTTGSPGTLVVEGTLTPSTVSAACQ